MLFALAYNRGPAASCRRGQDKRGVPRTDPLLFLESIDSPRGRDFFTKHVLTQLLDLPACGFTGRPPDLDALATGKWPTYIALDQRPAQDGRYAENR